MQAVHGWKVSNNAPRRSSHGCLHKPTFLARIVGSIGCAASISAAVCVQPAQAAIPEASLARWHAAYDELTKLDGNWESIVKGEGDNIRRKLGTVYTPPSCNSPLCNFANFVPRFIADNADDIDMDTFEGPSSELLEALNQADFTAYSSIFSEYGNGGGGADYINQSHKQIQRSIAKFREILGTLDATAAVAQ